MATIVTGFVGVHEKTGTVMKLEFEVAPDRKSAKLLTACPLCLSTSIIVHNSAEESTRAHCKGCSQDFVSVMRQLEPVPAAQA